jgi:hypothetical protein
MKPGESKDQIMDMLRATFAQLENTDEVKN